jgi:3D (Asp-Asp-Asp) domain-containing protein
MGIRRVILGLIVLALLGAGIAASADGTSSPARHAAAGVTKAGFTITEYWPAPESWFRGQRVTAAGIPGVHRVDWLYSGTGLAIEADGLTLDGKRVHVDEFGKERWVNAAGRPTRPTNSGVWTHGDPAWRAGGWRNAGGAVTFPLDAGGWSNGPAVSYSPVPGMRFAPGPSLPLTYYKSVAVDPRVIPQGSRIYIAAYRNVNGGWFVAQDTGSGIIGRHIDVFRSPPSTPDGGRFLMHQRVRIVAPVRHR